jgi:hypothetical protein
VAGQHGEQMARMNSLAPAVWRYLARVAIREQVLDSGIRLVTTRPVSRSDRGAEFSIELYRQTDDLPPHTFIKRGPMRTIMDLSEQELERWDGYELEVFGKPIDSSTPDDGHTWTINWAEEDGHPPNKVRLERQWVHYKDSPVRGELLRIPSQPDQRSIQWLDERNPSDTDLARARDGLALLDGLPRIIRGSGRPELSGHWRTPEAFRAEVDPLIRRLRAEGKSETRQQVAEYMPATAWRRNGPPVSLHARIRRLERATEKLFGLAWDEYTRTVK